MNKYAIYDERRKYLFDIYATSKDEAIALAKKSNRAATIAEFIDHISDW